MTPERMAVLRGLAATWMSDAYADSIHPGRVDGQVAVSALTEALDDIAASQAREAVRTDPTRAFDALACIGIAVAVEEYGRARVEISVLVHGGIDIDSEWSRGRLVDATQRRDAALAAMLGRG